VLACVHMLVAARLAIWCPGPVCGVHAVVVAWPPETLDPPGPCVPAAFHGDLAAVTALPQRRFLLRTVTAFLSAVPDARALTPPSAPGLRGGTLNIRCEFLVSWFPEFLRTV